MSHTITTYTPVQVVPASGMMAVFDGQDHLEEPIVVPIIGWGIVEITLENADTGEKKSHRELAFIDYTDDGEIAFCCEASNFVGVIREGDDPQSILPPTLSPVPSDVDLTPPWEDHDG